MKNSKGALTEQYVLQQLVVNRENDIFYWSADHGTGEIDFLVQMDDKIVPIEVKAEENLQAKSLKMLRAEVRYKICREDIHVRLPGAGLDGELSAV